MSEPETDADRLRRLDAKLREARARHAPPPRADEHYSRANQAWRMVIELVAGLGIGFGIGVGIDAALGTRPIFLVLFTLLGFAAGINVMLRTAREIGEDGSAHGGGRPKADAPAGARGTEGADGDRE